MAIANARRLDPAATETQPSADQKLEQIVALLGDRTRIPPALLRIKIRAVYEDIEVPAEMKAFIALAGRAGVSRNRQYSTWALVSGEEVMKDPARAAVTVLPREAVQVVNHRGAFRRNFRVERIRVGLLDDMSGRRAQTVFVGSPRTDLGNEAPPDAAVAGFERAATIPTGGSRAARGIAGAGERAWRHGNAHAGADRGRRCRTVRRVSRP